MNRVFSSAANGFRKVSHVIFDVDGLLLDTETLYTEAIQSVLDKFGKQYTWEIKCELMGVIGTEAAKKMVDIYDLNISYKEYYQLLKEQYDIVFENVALMPDSETFYKKAISIIAGRFGKKYTLDVQAKVVGTPEKESSRIAIAEMKLPISVEEFIKEFRKLSHLHLPSVPLLPGAEKLVRHLHNSKVPIAIATSSNQDAFYLKCSKNKELFSLFDHIVCGGTDREVKRGKPEPDIFLICASRFPDKPNPERCLVFEDSPNGVLAAKRAHMQCVMVPDEKLSEEYKKEATLVVKTLNDFKPELFGLPSY